MKFQTKVSTNPETKEGQGELHLFFGRETVAEIRLVDLPDVEATPQDMEDFIAKIFVEGMRFEALDYAHTSASRLKKLIAVTNN